MKLLLATTRFQCAGGVKILGFLVGGVVEVEGERFFVDGGGGTDIDEDRDALARTADVGSFVERVIVVSKLLKRLRQTIELSEVGEMISSGQS